MKNKLLAIGQILINLAFVPIYFIKFFHEVGVFPGEDANGSFITDRRDFYYSPYQNLIDGDCEKWMYLSFAWIAASIVSAILSLVFKNNKKVRYVSYGISACSAVAFAVAIALASTIYRAY